MLIAQGTHYNYTLTWIESRNFHWAWITDCRFNICTLFLSGFALRASRKLIRTSYSEVACFAASMSLRAQVQKLKSTCNTPLMNLYSATSWVPMKVSHQYNFQTGSNINTFCSLDTLIVPHSPTSEDRASKNRTAMRPQ